MSASERMNEFFETVSYVGTEEDIRPWRELEELATSDDEPDDPDPVPSRRKDMGGVGSGNFGHGGRPGEVGGSGPGGLSSAGDERTDSEGPPVGKPFRVFRIGSKKGTTLDNKNAGNADAVDDLYMRSLDDDGPGVGDTLHVFEVVLEEPTAGYQRFNAGVASPLPAVTLPIAEGTVGRHKRDVELLYSFPKGGKWTAKHVVAIPASKVFRQWGAQEERVAVIRQKVEEAIVAQPKSLRVFWLGGAGSGNFGHKGRPGEVGGSGEGEGGGKKQSVKGKNIRGVSDEADDDVVEAVLGLNSEAKVRDLAESMVQYVDSENFEVTIETEGAAERDDEELQEGYDEYVAEERRSAMHEWVSTRDDQHAAIEMLWEEVKNEPAPDSPYGDVREHPSLPFGEKLERPEPEAISFEDLTEGIADTTGPFTNEEKESIRERLRGTGGPQLPSRDDLVEQWETDHDGDEFGDSFSEWADEHGGSSGGSGDQSVKISFVGDKGTTIERTFTQGGNGIEVEHNFFRAGQQQGGLAKDLLRGSFEEYERLDVHEVKVHANIDIGGYAWAKFGFKTDSPPDLDSRIQEAYRTKRITGEEKQHTGGSSH